jgi:carbamoyl-phosphate synthase small subunit
MYEHGGGAPGRGSRRGLPGQRAGDPAALDYVVETVRGLVGRRPLWGICLGHQLLCRAVGLETFKLPFGHRGANHPVRDLETGRVEITSQNHGFAALGPAGARTIERDEPVRWDTDFGAAALTHVNLYDRTVEGLQLLDVPAATVQYHPEAGPGPHDSLYLFDRFLEGIGAAPGPPPSSDAQA